MSTVSRSHLEEPALIASQGDDRKPRGRPKTGICEPIGLRLYDNQLARLDAWINGQKDHPSRSEAIRRLLDQALAGLPDG